MARSDEYIINEAGTVSPYDIVLDDLGLNFVGETPMTGEFGPGPTTAKDGPGETALIFNDFSNGMGMGYSGVPNTYAYAINGYTRTPHKFMPGGKLTEISFDDFDITDEDLAYEIRAGEEWLNDVYIGAGRYILKLAGGIGAPTIEYDVGADCQLDSAIVYNNILLFSTDTLENNWQFLTGYDVDTGGWVTANDQPGGPNERFGAENYRPFDNPVFLQKMEKTFQEVDGIGGYRLIGNDSPFTFVQVQANDINTIIGDSTAYSAPILVGDTSYAITGIYETNRIFFVTKGDGVYGIESSGIYCPNYVPDLKDDPSGFNGISGRYFAGKLYVGTNEGVLMVDVADKQRQDVPILVSPSYYLANETPIFGIPTTMTTDNGWLVTALYNGTDSHICYLRPREQTLASIPNPVIWHGSECTIPGERITMMMKSSVSGRAFMYIGTHDGTRMHLYMLSLPTEGDPYTDYLHGEGHEFATECKLFLPFQDGGDPNAKKVIRRFETQADGLSFPVLQTETDDPDIEQGDILSITTAGEIYFYANADSGSRIFFEDVEPSEKMSEWNLQGVVSATRSTMMPSLNTISGSQIGILLVGTLLNQNPDPMGEPIYSPFAVRSIKIRTDIQVEQLEEKSYTVQLGHLKATKSGRSYGDYRTKFARLIALQDADAVYMIDEWQERVLVKVEPGIRYRYVPERNGQPASLVVSLRITLLGRQFYYDTDQAFDSIYSWGA